MIFGKAKNIESVDAPAGAYIRNETRNLVNRLVFAPAEVYTPSVIYDNIPKVELPRPEARNDSKKITIPIHVCRRKIANHRIYNEDPELNLVPTDLKEEGLDKFFDRVEDTIIHYKLRGYNFELVNSSPDPNYEPVEDKHFNALKNYIGIGLEEKAK